MKSQTKLQVRIVFEGTISLGMAPEVWAATPPESKELLIMRLHNQLPVKIHATVTDDSFVEGNPIIDIPLN